MTRENELDIGELKQIAGWLAASGVGFIEIARGRSVARMTLGNANAPVTAPAEPAVERPAQRYIKANHAGRLVWTHPGRSEVIAETGARLKAGDIVALLQMAELCLPVIAPVDGVLGEWLVEEGVVVGFGTSIASIA